MRELEKRVYRCEVKQEGGKREKRKKMGKRNIETVVDVDIRGF
jgi:hypothetical protein